MSELTLEEREKRLQRILADAEIRAQGVWRTGTVVTAHSPEREERNIKKPTQPSIKGVSVKSPDSTWVVTIQLDKDSQTMNGSSRVTLEVPLKNLKMPIHKLNRVKFRKIFIANKDGKVESSDEILTISDSEYADLQEERQAMSAENLHGFFVQLQETSRTWDAKIEDIVKQKYKAHIDELADYERALSERDKAASQREQDIQTQEATLNDKRNEISVREENITRVEQRYSTFIEYIKDDEHQAEPDVPALLIPEVLPTENATVEQKMAMLAVLTAVDVGALVLFNGPVGVGKTHLVGQLAQRLSGSRTKNAMVLPVRPGWLDPSDLVGYYDAREQMFRPTPFTEALQRAIADDDCLNLLCLDEMNLARIENYAADLLSQLEYGGRGGAIPLYSRHAWNSSAEADVEVSQAVRINRQNYRHKMKLPPNVAFIGTLNTDETTYDLSPKVIDRSFVVEFSALDKKVLRGEVVVPELAAGRISLNALREAKEEVDVADFAEAREFLIHLNVEYLQKGIGIPLGMRAMQHFDGWMRTAIVLGVDVREAFGGFVAAKILPRVRFRKADERNDLLLEMLESFRDSKCLTISVDSQLNGLGAKAESDETSVVRYFGLA